MSTQKIINFNTKVSEVIEQNTPFFNSQHYSYPLPPFIIKLIKEKRKMLREYYSRPDPEIKTKINQFAKNIQKLIFEYKQNLWLSTCNEINQEKGKNFYNKIKKLTRYKASPSIPDLEENGVTYTSDQEKANKFYDHYIQYFKERNHPSFDNDNKENINRWYNTYFNHHILEQPNTELDANDY